MNGVELAVIEDEGNERDERKENKLVRFLLFCCY